MSITIRLRGKIYHARGSVRVGKEVVRVAEFSTGQSTRAAALQTAEREAARIRDEALDGRAGRARGVKVGDCFADYLTRPGGIARYDEGRVDALNEIMGDLPIERAAEGWQDWIAAHPRVAPGTVQRWRTILAAALRHGCEARGLTPPALPSVRMPREVRVVYLTPRERARLLAAYNPHAACPILVLAYQGLRTQEALRMDWRHVDLKRDTIHIPAAGTKTGRGRTVPMHDRVMRMIDGLWHAQGKPDAGPVFLSSRGEPYRDTREGSAGNPLARAHITACAHARVTGFRVHDWRHDWAARHVMAGTDLYTLMRLGGWTSMRMVERYSGVTADHMRDAARRIA